MAANVAILNSGKAQRGVERRGILLARADRARNLQQAGWEGIQKGKGNV